MDKRSPVTIDHHIAERLKARRAELRWSMKQLGDRLGISVQQVQKYESAINRISAGRLYEIARIMRVPFAYFVEGFVMPVRPTDLNDEDIFYASADILGGGSTMENDAEALASAFMVIRNERVRQSLLTLAQAWAAER